MEFRKDPPDRALARIQEKRVHHGDIPARRDGELIFFLVAAQRSEAALSLSRRAGMVNPYSYE